jgi:hypothetical protein
MRSIYYFATIGLLAISASAGASAASKASDESLEALPPNWTSGGGASVQKLHSKKAADLHSSRGNEAQFSSTASKSRRHTLGVLGSVPELTRMDYRYAVSPFWAFTLGVSAPMPVEVDISMPTDVIKADAKKGLAVAYPAFDIKFKIDWGPHFYAGAVWHPFGGTWYSSAGLGVRSIRIQGHAATPLRICSISEAVKEPPCGNDSAAIQTRTRLSLKADIKLLSYTARAATGWVLPITPAWVILAEAGVFVPFNTKENTKILAELVDSDGNAEEVSGALGELRTKSEEDVKAKTKSELSKYTNKMLPVLGVGLGFRF